MQYDPRKTAMGVSFGVSFVMLAGKIAAYVLTGSSAIFSDAAESVIHLLATGFAGFSLWYSVLPADENHLYGHGKIAYFSAGVEGVLILTAAAAIFYTAVRDFILGPELERLGTGLLITAALSATNLSLGGYLVRTGKRHNSLVLVSNGRHVLTDMWTSLGVLVGVFLVWLTGIVWLDPLVAVLVALNILWTAYRLLRQSVGGLMEYVNAEDTKAIAGALDEAIRRRIISNYHQLRHRRVNDQIWVEYHLLFPPSISITDAHSRSHDVEKEVAALFPEDRVHVTAHLEPETHSEAHPEGHAEADDPLQQAGAVRL
jgi:cation diffusion facilitator family transporter